MNIEELAKRKTELHQILQAMQMCNVYGKTIEELTDMELSKIKARKELYEVEAQIDSYIKTAA